MNEYENIEVSSTSEAHLRSENERNATILTLVYGHLNKFLVICKIIAFIIKLRQRQVKDHSLEEFVESSRSDSIAVENYRLRVSNLNAKSTVISAVRDAGFLVKRESWNVRLVVRDVIRGEKDNRDYTDALYLHVLSRSSLAAYRVKQCKDALVSILEPRFLPEPRHGDIPSMAIYMETMQLIQGITDRQLTHLKLKTQLAQCKAKKYKSMLRAIRNSVNGENWCESADSDSEDNSF